MAKAIPKDSTSVLYVFTSCVQRKGWHCSSTLLQTSMVAALQSAMKSERDSLKLRVCPA